MRGCLGDEPGRAMAGPGWLEQLRAARKTALLGDGNWEPGKRGRPRVVGEPGEWMSLGTTRLEYALSRRTSWEESPAGNRRFPFGLFAQPEPTLRPRPDMLLGEAPLRLRREYISIGEGCRNP